MERIRLTICVSALWWLAGTQDVIAAPIPKTFDWQAAPTEVRLATLTLREAILRAFARHPKIAQASAQIRVGEANLDAAKSAWYPQISLQASGGRAHQTDSAGSLNNNASGGIRLSQLIWDFGRTNRAVDEQYALSDAYLYSLYDTMTTVAQDTLRAYLQVKRDQALVEAAAQNILSLKRVRDIAGMRAGAGLSSRSDVLQAETRLAGMQATLEQYRAQQRSAQANLSVLTGVMAADLPDLPKSLLQQPIRPENIAYANSAAVRSAQAKQQAAAQRVQQAASGHWPTIRLEAGRTRYKNDNYAWWDDEVQLRVEAPLYEGGLVNAKTRSAEGEQAAAQAAVRQAKLDINQRAATAWADLIGAQHRQQAGETQLLSASHTRSVYADEYKLSKRSLNDLLSVEQDVFQADSMRIMARFDGWDAAVRYAAAVDNLLDMMGIERKTGSRETLPSLQ